ncbi:MAG: chorismate synthase [Alkaliphilus sp.]|nr:chorismate synthase [Alkaliphilus sp.]
MSGTWGKNIRYSIFGESHGEGLGIIIDGLPPGIALDMDEINFEMNRRRPGNNPFGTPRNEKDEFRILSGYFENKTTGAPFCIFIQNNNQKSKDYEATKNILRPSHADLTAFIKYKGFHDFRGGGHFSGRLTAPLVFAGAVAKQLLKTKNIFIGAHISQIGGVFDSEFDKVGIGEEILQTLKKKEFPVLDEKKASEMKKLILSVKEGKDSVGGTVETAIINLPAGIGNPFFDSVESSLAHLLFSIPAVKGVEFGAGFKIASMNGSKANDELYMDDDKIKSYTNNNGGILGGISNGMPVIFKVAFKPTPSIGKTQRTIDYRTKENEKIEINGRHDPCIVPRALVVVEAVAAMGILDLMLAGDSLQ